MFAGVDSIARKHSKAYFTPNLTSSEGAYAAIKGYSQQIADLMSQQWHLSQIDHSLQVNQWRNDVTESSVDK